MPHQFQDSSAGTSGIYYISLCFIDVGMFPLLTPTGVEGCIVAEGGIGLRHLSVNTRSLSLLNKLLKHGDSDLNVIVHLGVSGL
jgi:hypothetical protein